MKFGQFELVRWHQDVTPEDSIRRAMERIELGDEIGMDEIWLAEHHFSRHGLVSGIFSLLGLRMGIMAKYVGFWRRILGLG